MPPALSVVMPVFNSAEYLRVAIDSILGQTFSDFEFLIINDRSTDSSENVIKEYCRKDSRIKLLQNAAQKGIVGALNTGLNHARGEYIARMDGDDISEPRRIEKQLQFMQAHPDVGVCGIWIELFDARSGVWQLPQSHEEICCSMLFSNVVTAVVMRKSAIDQGNYRYDHDYNFAEDYELWSRMSERHRLANVPEVLYRYRRHDTTIGSIERTVQPENAQRVRRRSLKRLGIVPSRRESDLHWQISDYQYQANSRFADDASRWFSKILEANLTHRVYDHETLRDHLQRRNLEIKSLVPRKKPAIRRIFKKLRNIAKTFHL